MSHNISINVPYNRQAVSAAARMLAEVAESFNEPAPELKSTTACDDEPKKVLTEADAKADLAGDPRPDNPSPEATAMQEAEAKAVFAAPVETPAPEAVVPVADVELDANDLPWDERIHASSKTKDVKGNWKYKRGVDRDILVPEVEAELKATIPEPETGAVNVPPAPVEATPPPPLATAPTPGNPTGIPAPDTGTPSINVTTFAQLVTAITANSIAEEKVKEALDKVRIGNFALLGARPDLIPAVAGHLGL